MMSFPIHTPATAPAASRPLLDAAAKRFGFVPNLLGVLAESPAALEAYLSVSDALGKGRLTPVEREIATITVSAENRCEYCVAAHSTVAAMVKAPADVIAAARSGGPIHDRRLEALRRFAQSVVATRGRPDAATLHGFLAAGYDQSQVLEVLAVVAFKTLSNYTNHIAATPLDDAFAPQRWESGAVAA
jgi:uncharacterized peroxidase-related enzyme